MGLRLSVTSLCKSKDDVLRENVSDVKSGKNVESIRRDDSSGWNGKAGKVLGCYVTD